jgi:hypothetical protein
MAPASNTVAALRAENARLKEQLTAERCASQQKLLLAKDQLLASKDKILSIRASQLRQCSVDEAENAAGSAKRHCVSYSSNGIVLAAPLDEDEILAK